jgi:hypothetical protein
LQNARCPLFLFHSPDEKLFAVITIDGKKYLTFIGTSFPLPPFPLRPGLRVEITVLPSANHAEAHAAVVT